MAIIVAIDGYSSCGKSTIAKQLANYAAYTYVDTGAMYRAVGLFCLQNDLISETEINESELHKKISELNISFKIQSDSTQHIMLNGKDVESEIRSLEVANAASRVSVIPFVRKELVRQQQLMGLQKGIVMDGRDIGTVVFVDAELKLFLTASPEIRAQRRYDELTAKGETVNFADVLANVKERDYRDTNRTESPLRKAADAIEIDNSLMTKEEQMEQIINIFEQRK